jgi:hypothetical protein
LAASRRTSAASRCTSAAARRISSSSRSSNNARLASLISRELTLPFPEPRAFCCSIRLGLVVL